MNSPVQTTCTTPSPAVSLPLKESLSIEAHGSQDEREWLTTAQPRRRKQQKEVITPHHVLKSIFKWAWDIEVSRSHSGWRVNLRTYNLIPHHSPAHEAIIEGNVQRLQELLGKGLASPFDVVVENKYRGAFLLHVTLLEVSHTLLMYIQSNETQLLLLKLTPTSWLRDMAIFQYVDYC